MSSNEGLKTMCIKESNHHQIYETPFQSGHSETSPSSVSFSLANSSKQPKQTNKQHQVYSKFSKKMSLELVNEDPDEITAWQVQPEIISAYPLQLGHHHCHVYTWETL